MRWSRIKRVALGLGATLVVLLAVRSSIIRAYRVDGASGAPTILTGELVWVNLARYDLRLPFTRIRLLYRSTPVRGEVMPSSEAMVVKSASSGSMPGAHSMT